MRLTEILAWRRDRLATLRESTRAEEMRIRAETDRMLRFAIDEAKSVEGNQHRIARRLGVHSSQLAHHARKLGIEIPTRPYRREC